MVEATIDNASDLGSAVKVNLHIVRFVVYWCNMESDVGCRKIGSWVVR